MPRILKIIYEYFALYSSLTLLGLICLTWSIFALPLYFILPARAGTAVGRFGIMAGFRIYSWSLSLTRTYRLDLRAVDTLRGGPPLILAPNHPALIDALLILTRHPNLVCVMKSELMNNVFLGSGSRLARYVRNDSSRQMVKESVAHLQAGGVLLLFPEGTRTTRAPINPLVGSVGLIAKHAKVPVQTLLIETDSPFLAPVPHRGKTGEPAFVADTCRFLAELRGEDADELAEATRANFHALFAKTVAA